MLNPREEALERLGWELEPLMERTILAIRSCEEPFGSPLFTAATALSVRKKYLIQKRDGSAAIPQKFFDIFQAETV